MPPAQVDVLCSSHIEKFASIATKAPDYSGKSSLKETYGFLRIGLTSSAKTEKNNNIIRTAEKV